MNFLLPLILAALCAAAMSDRIAEWQEHAKECSEKHNIAIADIHKAMMGEINPADINSNYKCMFLCMSEKEGLTKDGALLADALTEKLVNAPNKEGLTKAIAACKNVKGTDNCDSAYKVMTCLAANKAV